MHKTILKRVGTVLLLIGLLDIGVMAYCIANQISYSSSFNIFAIVAGIFLVRGSLKAAVYVRWFATFLLSGFLAMGIVSPFLQPFGLTLTQLKLNPGSTTAWLVGMILVLGLLLWIVRELGAESIQSAVIAAGVKLRNNTIAMAAGIGMVAITLAFTTALTHGVSGDRAKAEAVKLVGSGYSFHISSLSVQTHGNQTTGSAVVTAWNEKEIRAIQVHWEGQ